MELLKVPEKPEGWEEEERLKEIRIKEED